MTAKLPMAAWEDRRRFRGLPRVEFIPILLGAKGLSLGLLWMFLTVDAGGDVYHLLARNLAFGHGFVLEAGGPAILWRGPIYPLFLAGLWRLAGVGQYSSVVGLQAAMDILTCLLVYAIACRLCPPRWAAMAALGVAVYPPASYYTLRYMTETLFTLLLAGFVMTIYRATESRRMLTWFVAGILGGVAALTRPSALTLPVLVAGWLVASGKHRRTLAAGLLLAGSVAVISPWAMRNFMVSGHIIPVTTGGGYSLWVGNRVTSDGREDDELDPSARVTYEADRSRIAQATLASAEAARRYNITPDMDRRFAEAALAGMASDPGGTLVLFAKKAFRLWFSVYSPERRGSEWGIWFIHGVLLAGGLWGAVSLRGQRRTVWPIFVVLLHTTLVHVVVVSTVRYSVPVIPYFIILTAAGLSACLGHLRGEGKSLSPNGPNLQMGGET